MPLLHPSYEVEYVYFTDSRIFYLSIASFHLLYYPQKNRNISNSTAYRMKFTAFSVLALFAHGAAFSPNSMVTKSAVSRIIKSSNINNPMARPMVASSDVEVNNNSPNQRKKTKEVRIFCLNLPLSGTRYSTLYALTMYAQTIFSVSGTPSIGIQRSASPRNRLVYPPCRC